MKVIKKQFFLENNILSYIPKNSLFFDIETLGLSYKYAPIYLIGCFLLEDATPTIILFFSENATEEEKILLEFLDLMEGYDTIITFNGDSFDIPFVKNRGEKFGISFPFDRHESIDIYKKIKPYKSLLSLDRLNQKTLEEFLGIFREDKYNGGELINVYKSYEKTRDKNLEEMLILHNYEDVLGMTSLFSLLSYEQLTNGDYDIDIDTNDSDNILFRGTLPLAIPKDVRLLNDYIHTKVSETKIQGVINTVYGEYKHFLPKYKDYVYLPLEDMVIPKSLGDSIPSNKKEKATKKNCFVKKEGYFLKLPCDKCFKSLYSCDGISIYKKDYDDKEMYIKIDSSINNELPIIIKALIQYSCI